MVRVEAVSWTGRSSWVHSEMVHEQGQVFCIPLWARSYKLATLLREPIGLHPWISADTPLLVRRLMSLPQLEVLQLLVLSGKTSPLNREAHMSRA
jgi:hypothetical protein